jgi:hypothetical protein
MKRIVSLLATLCLFQSSHAATAVPDAISFQGRALTATGALMGAGTPVNRTVTFRIWDHPSNSLVTNLLYSEQQVVTIAEGEFSVLIGTGTATAGTPLTYSETEKGLPTVKISDAFGGVSRYLGVTIDDGTDAVDNEISPRQQFVTSTYAMRSKVAEGVDSSAITTAMLANNSVTTTQVNDAAITNSKLADNAVTATQIVDATITTAKLADASVTTAKIANLNVTTAKLADANVTTDKIANLNVTTDKIAAGAVTGAKIASGTIAAGNLATGAVTSTAILDGTIATADIANSTITSAKIADGNVSGTDIAYGTITSDNLGTNTATTTENLRIVRGSISQTATNGATILLGSITTLTPVIRGTGWYLNGTTAIAQTGGTGYFRKVVFNPPFSDTPTITSATHVNYSDQNQYSTYSPNFRYVTKDGFEVSVAAGYYYGTAWNYSYFGFLPVDFIAIGPR